MQFTGFVRLGYLMIILACDYQQLKKLHWRNLDQVNRFTINL